MNLPKRKRNRLEGYDYSQNGAYFITVCTSERKAFLSEIVGDDAHIVPKPYGKTVEKFLKNIPGLKKYIIMPNHIHMIIIIDNGTMKTSSPTNSIPQIIKSFKTLVTKEIGFPIFQRSYYDHVIRSENDYQEIWSYIEANPKRWQDDKFYSDI